MEQHTLPYLLCRASKIRVRLKLHVALDVLGVVDDGHLPVLVDPQLSDHDVVHDCLDFSPSVVIAGLCEHEVRNPQGFDLEVFSLEL